MCPKSTCGAVMPSRRSTSRMPRRPPRRSAAPERSRSTGPEPERVERGDRGDVAGAQRRRADRMARPPLARHRDPGARGRARAGADRRVVGALRELVQERVDRRERGLVVVGPRALLGQPHDPARHRAGGEPLERRHGRVQVDVVAVDARRRRRAARRRDRRAAAAPARRARSMRCASGPAAAGSIGAERPRKPDGPRSAAARRSSPRPARGRGCRPASAARPRARARRPPRRGTAPRARRRRGAAPRAARARRRARRGGRRRPAPRSAARAARRAAAGPCRSRRRGGGRR